MTLRQVAAAAIFAAGVALLGAAAWSALQAPPPPYAIRQSRAPKDAAAAYAALGAFPGEVERFEIVESDSNRPLVEALLLKGADGRRTPLGWSNRVAQPIFFPELIATDEARVLQAIKEHTPEDAVVLAWWDLSRRIRAFASRRAPLDDPQARGLLVPDAWSDAGAKLSQEARAFWGAGVAVSEAGGFQDFLDALLATTEDEGADKLAQLGGGRPVFVVLRLDDLLRVSTARPDALALAHRDFVGAGDVHSAVKAVREWLNEQKIEGAHAVEPLAAATRLLYLPRPADSQRLLVRLLPFSTSNPLTLERLQLAHQFKGYWVYEAKQRK